MSLSVETRHAVSATEAKGFDTEALRGAFHARGLFTEGEIRLVYTHYDRMVLGGAVPGAGELVLDHVAECGTASFLDRREMAVVNIGGSGTVTAEGKAWELGRGDVLYIGRGAGPVRFAGEGRFYILSAPAHRSFPARRISQTEANKLDLGTPETANVRSIFQFVHPTVMESCQLVMGYTRLAPGSVWNTMPCHTHDRRMEAYLYFDLPPQARVMHLMGEPTEIRSVVMANEEAVLSPPWSIHCGCGTEAYTFVWAMAGDNVDYTDMDMVAMEALR